MERRDGTSTQEERRWQARLAIASALVVFALLFGVHAAGWLGPMELAAHDAALRTRRALGERGQDAWHPPIAVVRISESDIQRFGHPIPDGVLAAALGRILEAGPRAVGVDLYRDLPVGNGREALAAQTDAHPELVWVDKLPDDEGVRIAPPDFVRRPSQIAFSDLVVDPDHQVRRALLFAWDAERRAHLALALRLSLAYLAREPEPVALAPVAPDGVDARLPLRLGRGSLTRLLADDGASVNGDDGGYQIALDFRSSARSLRLVPFAHVLDDGADLTPLRDAIVLVGTSSPSVNDRFPDPSGSGGADPATNSGVEVHGLVADQLLRIALRGDVAETTPGPIATWVGVLALAVVGGFAGLRLHSPARLVATLALATLGFGVLALVAAFANVRLPAPTGTLAFAGAATLCLAGVLRRERTDRAIIDRLLTSHVSRPVRDRLWAERALFLREGRLRSQRATVTVFFADLVGYASVAEAVAPEVLMRWLDECMGALAIAVEDHGGMVDDYWGDGMKANFGAPIPRTTRADVEHDARQAVRCALRFDRELAAMNARRAAEGAPAARMRIGIHTGPVVLGSIGGEARQKLTTVGDTVTVASRLESILRERLDDPTGEPPLAGFGVPRAGSGRPGEPQLVRILVSEETVTCLAGAFRTELLGEHALKGRNRKVCIHRVRGPSDDSGRRILTAASGDGA